MSQPIPKISHRFASVMGWLLCAALLWRLCDYGSEKDAVDALFASFFAILACCLALSHASPLMHLNATKWWVIYALLLFMLWPFWDNVYPQLLRYPALLTPVFISLAIVSAPQNIQRQIPSLILLSGAAHGVASLWQFFVVFPQLVADQQELQLTKAQLFRLEEGRTLGLSTSPDVAAIFCVVALFVGMSLYQSQAHRHRPIILLGTVLALCGVGLSRSTGALLCAVVSLALVLGIIFKHQMSAHRKTIMFALLGLPVFLIGFRGLDALQISSEERLLNWEGVWGIIEHHFLTGVGPGGFSAAYEMFRPMGSNITRYAHSFPLQLTAELGLLGGLMALTFYGAILVQWWRSDEPNGATIDQTWLKGAFWAISLHALIDYDFQHPQSVSLFATLWLLTALAAPSKEQKPALSNHVTRGFICLLALGVIVGGLFVSERENVLQRSRSLHHPLSELTAWIAAHPQDMEAQMALLARVHYQQTHCGSQCSQWAVKSSYYADLWHQNAPPIATGWLLTAQIAKTNGQMELALQRIDQALTLHPGMPQAWKFKLATFSHDPNYASWYKEAAQWLHGTYQLKGFPKP